MRARRGAEVRAGTGRGQRHRRFRKWRPTPAARGLWSLRPLGGPLPALHARPAPHLSVSGLARGRGFAGRVGAGCIFEEHRREHPCPSLSFLPHFPRPRSPWLLPSLGTKACHSRAMTFTGEERQRETRHRRESVRTGGLLHTPAPPPGMEPTPGACAPASWVRRELCLFINNNCSPSAPHRLCRRPRHSHVSRGYKQSAQTPRSLPAAPPVLAVSPPALSLSGALPQRRGAAHSPSACPVPGACGRGGPPQEPGAGGARPCPWGAVRRGRTRSPRPPGRHPRLRGPGGGWLPGSLDGLCQGSAPSRPLAQAQGGGTWALRAERRVHARGLALPVAPPEDSPSKTGVGGAGGHRPGTPA